MSLAQCPSGPRSADGRPTAGRVLQAQLGADYARILEVFNGDPPGSPWPTQSFKTQALAGHVADRLLGELELDHRGIAEALSDHLTARLAALVRDLDEIGRECPSQREVPAFVDRLGCLRW